MNAVGPAGVMYLILVGVWVPVLALKSAHRLRGGAPLPISRTRMFIQTSGFLLFLSVMAWLTALREWINLTSLPHDDVRAMLYAALFLIALVLTLRLRWAARPLAERARLYSILPHDGRELGVYLIVCLIAGVGEEVIYRGVLATLLQRLTNSFIAAVLIASFIFAISHAIQGWRAALSIFFLAIAAHALVAATGSLLPMMIVHAAYDAFAGLIIPRWYVRDLARLNATLPAAAPAV